MGKWALPPTAGTSAMERPHKAAREVDLGVLSDTEDASVCGSV